MIAKEDKIIIVKEIKVFGSVGTILSSVANGLQIHNLQDHLIICQHSNH